MLFFFPIDEAFDTSDDANATIISDNALSARTCSGFDLANLRPPAPPYLQTTFSLDHAIQSGFYVYFTCKKTPYPELAYREYQEPDDVENPDDGVDGKFGVYCTDGGFTRRPWPKEEECAKVSICKDLPKPGAYLYFHHKVFLIINETLFLLAPSKKYKKLSVGFVAKDQFIYYECDDNSILDDNSGRNFFTLQCQGDDEVGIYKFPEIELIEIENISDSGNETATISNGTISDDNSANNNSISDANPPGYKILQNATFTPINDTFEFPKCRRKCSSFYIGRSDFTVVNDSIEYRAGDFAEFACDEGYFIEGSDYANRSVIQMCQDSGLFQFTKARCAPIPCLDEDISAVTPVNGLFVTSDEGEIPVDETLTFLCTDEAKVPNDDSRSEIETTCLLGGTFDAPVWPEDPGCVDTCNNFPNVPKMKKVSKKPVLAGRAIEYICKNSKKIPHTGERFFINCTDNGKFEGELENFPGTDWPECVVGCVDFPEMDNFKPREKFYKLPNDTIEYECSKLGLVPHTGIQNKYYWK